VQCESVDQIRYAERMNRLTRGFGVLGIAGFLISAGTLFGQSKEDLRRKYGEPLSEVFMLRPGISVTATYGTNGRIIELLISPHFTSVIKSRGMTLSRDSVNAIINELVPDSVRGKGISAGFMNVACPENDCSGFSQEFQHVTIYYNTGRAGEICYAVVKWKD
jgi:hypothetical protein